MTDEKIPQIHTTIGGDVRGQVAIGSGITQTKTVTTIGEGVTQADVQALRRLIAELESRVEREAPPDKAAAALERVRELDAAVTSDVPDLTTLQYVQQWFVKHLPALAGSVTSLVVHPLVGKFVGAAGDAMVAEFQKRFGGSSAR
jgi:hypothetical protein